MNQDQIVNIIVYAALVFIAILITRAIFSIGTIVKNLQAQTDLLAIMALAQGGDREMIRTAIGKAKGVTIEKEDIEKNLSGEKAWKPEYEK